MSDALTQQRDVGRIPLLALRGLALLPHQQLPLFVGRRQSVEAVARAWTGNGAIFVAVQIDEGEELPGPTRLHADGVIGRVVDRLVLPDGTWKVLIEGCQRARFADLQEHDGMLTARALPRVDVTDTIDAAPDTIALKGLVAKLAERRLLLFPQTLDEVQRERDPAAVADRAAAALMPSPPAAELAAFLGTDSAAGRVATSRRWVAARLDAPPAVEP